MNFDTSVSGIVTIATLDKFDVGNVYCDDAEKLHSDLIGINPSVLEDALDDAMDVASSSELASNRNAKNTTIAQKVSDGSKTSIDYLKQQDDNFVLSAIFCTIEENNLEGLEKLLSMANIDINKTNKHGEGAIHVAAGLGQLDILKMLVGKGGNLGMLDQHGDSAIYWSALCRCTLGLFVL